MQKTNDFDIKIGLQLVFFHFTCFQATDWSAYSFFGKNCFGDNLCWQAGRQIALYVFFSFVLIFGCLMKDEECFFSQALFLSTEQDADFAVVFFGLYFGIEVRKSVLSLFLLFIFLEKMKKLAEQITFGVARGHYFAKQKLH